MATFKAIAAMSRNRVIGLKNKIPWHLPEELQWFRKITLNQRILMGRKTFESLGSRPLPQRINYVMSHKSDVANKNVIVVHSFAALESIDGVIWICGGASIYQKFLPLCSEIMLTIVDQTVEGDTFFPDIPPCFKLSHVAVACPAYTVQCWVRSS
ncbi:MAG: dihydrofolate reductase [Puniceicoccales bacterium]|jgi:dihydrofolate reductase|nr:dihydrofolate reductase [Puniceicoccales bacterium]